MSDAIVIALIGSISTTAGIVITGLLNIQQGKKIVSKVKDYHEEVNGKMERLLDTTQALGEATGKAEGIAEKQPEIDQLNKDSTPKK